MDVMHAFRNRLRVRRKTAAAGLLMQMDHTRSIGADERVEDAFAVRGRLNEDRSGTVPENHARRPVGVVDYSRHLVRSYHDHFAALAGGNELAGNRHGIKKTRASR